MEEELRVYILFRSDIEIPMGKAIAHGGHAASRVLKIARIQNPDLYRAYAGPETEIEDVLSKGEAKITVRAKLKQIEKSLSLLKETSIPHCLIIDAGRTVFSEPTVTCLGIGPVRRSELPKFIQNLQLF